MALPEAVTPLTGISNGDVRGQQLDSETVTGLADATTLIIAHNAGFDRRFLERRFPLFIDKP